MKIILIKRKGLRRVVMVLMTPFVAFEYMWLGLRSMFYEFKNCWHFDHPETP